jgi:hypothetical protein
MTERGFFIIQGRWEQSREPGVNNFFDIDQIGGSLDDAKSTAQDYLRKHIAANHPPLKWTEGAYNRARCWYAHYNAIITFRITH